MAIITIARQLGALGDDIAEELSSLLSYRFIDRKQLETKLADCGLSETHLKKYDEKKPSFLASLNRDRDVYLNYLQTAVLEAAVTGKCIFLGRGVFAILAGVPDVIRIRLIASEQVRLERVMKSFDCDARKAAQLISRSDADRAGFHQSFFNIDPADPANYHLVINTDSLGISSIASLIKEAVVSFDTSAVETESLALLQTKLIGQKIVNHLLFEQNLSIHFLESSATADTITLYGVATSVAAIDSAVSTANRMAEGRRIESSITVVHDYKSCP